MNMYLKNEVLLVWFICLSCNLIMTGCQVVWVNRNVTDSFRVGENGCTKDESACTDHDASCQSDGQCLCPTAKPNFRKPTRPKTYGCLSNEGVRSGIGESSHCPFGPFQPIPSTRQQDSATAQFSDLDNLGVNFSGCTLRKAQAKLPINATEMELQWLNESYVDLTIVGGKTLHLQWRKSVPSLRGTIITLHLLCSSAVSAPQKKCLRAKILGTWPADIKPVTTEPTVTSFLPKTTSFVAMTTSTTEKHESTSTSISCSEEESSESSSINVALVAVLVISLIVNVVLGIIVGFLWKKIQRMKNHNLEMTEIPNIKNQKKKNSGNRIYDGVYEESIPLSGHDNNKARSSDPKYEEPSNYEPLRRNHLQDESDEHNYESLTTSHKGK